MNYKLLFIFVLLNYTTLHAQTDTLPASKSPFAKGTKALLFQISNNFTLRSFEGGLISFKHHFSEKNALRIGISFSGNHDENTDHNVSYPVDTLNQHFKDVNSTASFSIYSSYIHYLNNTSVIKTYYGIGLYVGYDHRYLTYDENPYNNINTWSFGPTGLFGVEWFPHSNIGLIAEYNFSGKLSFGKSYVLNYRSSDGSGIKTHTTTYSYGLGQQNVRLGLSVYL